MINFIKQNEQWVAKAQEVFDLQQQRKLWEEKEAIAIDQLKSMNGDLNSFGGGFKYEGIVRIGNIDYKAVPQLKGVNLDIYRKSSTLMWKLTYVGKVAEELE